MSETPGVQRSPLHTSLPFDSFTEETRKVSFILIHGAFLPDNLARLAWEALSANWLLV